jgi:hypothetical protein
MSMTDRPLPDATGERALAYMDALFRASGPVPFDDVDWQAFHARLGERAELSLARRRHPHVAPTDADIRIAYTGPATVPLAWWEHAARWSRPIVAGAVAAGVALIMVIRASPREAADAMVASAATTSRPWDRTRAAFDSVAIGHGTALTIDSALLPSAADLLIPLGRGVAAQ